MSSIIRFADQNVTEIASEEVPSIVPIIPLRNAVVLPGVLLPIYVGRTESVQLVESVGTPGTLIGLFTQKQPSDEDVSEEKLYHIGTLAEIHRILPMGEGGFQVFLQGVHKIRLHNFTERQPYLQGEISAVLEQQDCDDEQFRHFQAHVIRYIEAHPGIPDEIIAFVKRIKSASALANQVVFFSQRDIKEKVGFLQIESVAEKIRIVQEGLIEETSHLRMDQEMRDRVEQDTSRVQKEFYLRKQLEAIRKELGETDDDDLEELEQQLAELDLSEEVQKAVDKEMRRLRRASEGPHGGGMEANQIRNWLELVVELPWGEPERREIDLGDASRILDEDHEGLEEVKKRILEFLAVEKRTGGGRAPILCFVGPPGVGKTSLARSIARATGRNFVRSSLGGVRDEAEIRGHRRTYVGAMAGKILSAMKKAESRDPVFLLDEIDKTSYSNQGDPAAALLEVLDPEQNNTFEDHYLGLDYDLSRVLFVATANFPDQIPGPLKDRMEIIRLSGYTAAEKRAIARAHLIPRVAEQLSIQRDNLRIDEAGLNLLIRSYTREAGVRQLQREIESLGRKSLRELLENESGESLPPAEAHADSGAGDGESGGEVVDDLTIELNAAKVRDLLGRERFDYDYKEESAIPGLAVGLAWTPVGGDILYIETADYPGQGHLKLSGQLGDVMQESAQAALSFIRSSCDKFGIDPRKLAKRDIHVHIPGGAIPKDGPSAGVTLLTALVSRFTRLPLASDIAMTGEISLRGRVLPVGGIKEKVLAAQAAGIHQVILPERNRAEFEEIPTHITEGIVVEYYSEMLPLVLRAIPGLEDYARVERARWQAEVAEEESRRKSNGGRDYSDSDGTAALAQWVADNIARPDGKSDPREGW